MAAVKPSPPPLPAGTVVVVLALVRSVLALTLALGRVLLVAAEALPYLVFAALWVISAAAATKVVGSRAWDEGSAPAVFLQALADGALKASFLVLQALGAVMLCGQFLLYVAAAVSGSGSEFQKRAHGAFNQELIRGVPPRTAVLGTLASTPFVLLILAGSLVECMMSKKIGSVIVDVGIYGSSAIPCFVVIPAVVLSNWREDQMSKKNMTHLADS
ncbi:uncharacterized protein LOC119357629 [Triticum dicoccoides]|uniref:uncharacterized protein LOC119357629 n=1 Tax=Triticum dicoccoides TaxID=85692 RepID=UPI00162B936C|nr:uncharacterized protein LOC119357629 [Triticum dicoccoides]